jgi:hypothetical protein
VLPTVPGITSSTTLSIETIDPGAKTTTPTTTTAIDVEAQSSNGAIIGGAVGGALGLLVVVIVGIVLFKVCRARRASKASDAEGGTRLPMKSSTDQYVAFSITPKQSDYEVGQIEDQRQRIQH